MFHSSFEPNGSNIVEHVQRRATLNMLIHCACEEIAKEREHMEDSQFATVKLSHHIGDTTFYGSESSVKFSSDDAKEINNKIQNYINGEDKVEFREYEKQTLIEYFINKNRNDKVQVVKKLAYPTTKEVYFEDDSSSEDEGASSIEGL